MLYCTAKCKLQLLLSKLRECAVKPWAYEEADRGETALGEGKTPRAGEGAQTQAKDIAHKAMRGWKGF